MPSVSVQLDELAPLSPPKARLRIGVIVNSPLVPKWAQHILTEIDGSCFGQLTLIARLRRSPAISATESVRLRDEPVLFRLWRELDQRFFARRCARPEIFQPVAFSPHYDCPAQLECEGIETGAGLSLSPPDLSTIRDFQLDVLIDLTNGLTQEELVTAAHHGTWSLGDAQQSIASLFWVLFRGDSVLRNTVDIRKDGRVYRSQPGSWSAVDRLSLFRNASNLYWNKSELILRQLANLHRDSLESFADSLPTQRADVHAVPTDFQVVRLLARLVGRAAKEQFTKRFLREDWFLAFRKISEEPAASHALFTRMCPPRGHFYADPFVFDRDGKTYIFFEDYSYDSRKAVISCVELDDRGSCSEPFLALDEEFHLSYPQVFEWDGEIYLLPETKNNGTIQLYRATHFPYGWQLAHVLLRDVSAVDSTLFHHNGKFWLFTSGLGTEDPWFDADGELSLFFSDSLFGPWTPHPRNPIVSDVRGCRCAGQLFFRDGQLIRPAQDCSKVYGYAVTLNRVDTLSETAYHETPISSLPPDWMKGNRGTHTYNRSSTYEALDGRTLIARHWPRPSIPRIKSTLTAMPELTWAWNNDHDD